MKHAKYVMFSLVFLHITVSFAQNKKNSWMEMDLKGKVKYMEECEYVPEEKDGKVIKGKMVSDRWKFDKHYFFNKFGSLVKKESYLEDKHLIFRTAYIYDKNWRKIKGKKEAFEKDRRGSQTLFEYDKNGNKTGEYEYFSDSTTEFDFFTYNEKGSILTYINMIDSIVYEKYISTYDDKERLIQADIFFGPGATEPDVEKMIYNENGDVVEASRNEEVWYYQYKRDENNRIMEKRVSDDPKGNKITWITTYEYDIRGNKVLVCDTSLTYKSKEIICYTYDKKGNWINMIIYKNGKPISFFERKIKYF